MEDFDQEFPNEALPVVGSQVAPVDEETDKNLRNLFPLHYKPPSHVESKYTTGRRFNVSRSLLQSMKLPPSDFVNLTKMAAENFVLAVTALQDTQMPKLSSTVLKIQQYFSGYRIIVIDLGLKKSDADKVCRRKTNLRVFVS
jgi:hypothetical protein